MLYMLLLFDKWHCYMHNCPWRVWVSIVKVSFSCIFTGRIHDGSWRLWKSHSSLKTPHLIWAILSCPFLQSSLKFRAFKNFLLWLRSYFTLCLYPVQLLFMDQEHSDFCFYNNASGTSTMRKHCMITWLCFLYCSNAWVWNLGVIFLQLTHK